MGPLHFPMWFGITITNIDPYYWRHLTKSSHCGRGGIICFHHLCNTRKCCGNSTKGYRWSLSRRAHRRKRLLYLTNSWFRNICVRNTLHSWNSSSTFRGNRNIFHGCDQHWTSPCRGYFTRSSNIRIRLDFGSFHYFKRCTSVPSSNCSKASDD